MADKPNSTFAKRVRAAKAREKQYEIRDDVISGLGLTIQPSGVRNLFPRPYGARAQALRPDRQRP